MVCADEFSYKKVLRKLNNTTIAVLTVELYFCSPLMRRLVSILFLSLMLLQAIPVLHFFAEKKEVFYSYVDEEEPEHKSKVEKKVSKEYLDVGIEHGVYCFCCRLSAVSCRL